MGNAIVNLNEFKMKKTHQKFYVTNKNLIHERRHNIRNVRKDFIKGYMKLLTVYIKNQQDIN
jgi:hypothetical protein